MFFRNVFNSINSIAILLLLVSTPTMSYANPEQSSALVRANVLVAFDVSTLEREDYESTALPSSTSFRIMELLPGDHEDEIAYRLQVADWNAPPRYEAISYA